MTCDSYPPSELPTVPPIRSREHGWPGKLYVVLGWISIGFFVLATLVVAVLAPVIGLGRGEPGILLFGLFAAAFMAGMTVFYVWLVRAVRDFRKGGWVANAILLPLAVLGNLLNLLFPENAFMAAYALASLGLTVLFIVYFWSRRQDFGIGV